MTSLQAFQHLALSTFVFPDSHTATSQLAPLAEAIPFPDNLTLTELPTTPNIISSISQDSVLAFTVPFDQISEFLKAAQEIPDRTQASNGQEEKMWLMKAARHNGHGLRRSIRAVFVDSWTSFVDLVKVRLLFHTQWVDTDFAARRDSRHCYYGIGILVNAFDIYLTLCVHAKTWLQLLACFLRLIRRALLLSIRLDCDN